MLAQSPLMQERCEVMSAQAQRLGEAVDSEASRAEDALQQRDNFWKAELAAKVGPCLWQSLCSGFMLAQRASTVGFFPVMAALCATPQSFDILCFHAGCGTSRG